MPITKPVKAENTKRNSHGICNSIGYTNSSRRGRCFVSKKRNKEEEMRNRKSRLEERLKILERNVSSLSQQLWIIRNPPKFEQDTKVSDNMFVSIYHVSSTGDYWYEYKRGYHVSTPQGDRWMDEYEIEQEIKRSKWFEK